MAYPLQFLDAEGTASATLNSGGLSATMTVGSDFQPGDLRVVWMLTQNNLGTGSPTFSSFPGWTQIFSPAANQAIFTQTLTAASVDGTMTFGTHAVTNLYYAALTIRNWTPGQTITGHTSVATSTPSTSVTVTASGIGGAEILVIFGNGPVSTIPTGTTQFAASDNSGSNFNLAALDNNPGLLLAGSSLPSGTSTVKNATIRPNSTGSTQSTSFTFFIAAAPDITSAITASAETDAGVAVTSAMLPSTTNAITPAQEVDTGVEVYNPLRAVSIRPPVYLTGNPVTASRVTWQASTPAAGSAVLVETSLDGGASWQTALNGGAVPGLVRGDTTTPVVLTRATMTRLLATDTSPFFMTLETDVSVDTSYNELVALGTFLITQVDITETGGPTGGGSGGGGGGNGVTGTGGSSTGGGLSLVVSGIDLSYAISRNTWTSIFYVPANTNYATAMLEIAQNRLPGITSDVASTEVTAQRLLFGTSQGADAWQDVQDMGTAIGSRAYFDPVGTFKVKPVADPALTPSVWTVSDAANPVMVSYTRSISDSTTYNYVVVSGESTSNAVPVSAVAFDADPSSPTYYLGPYNIVTTTFISAMITTTAQAQQAADALLLVVKGASETVQITMVPNPALEPGDVITVTRTFNGQQIIQGTFKINSMSTPVGQGQAQVLVCYRQSAAQG